MMAEVGFIEKVSGSRMATPLAPPRPGSTPMMVPSVMPRTARPRFMGWAATWKPRSRFSQPMLVAQPGLERSLGHGHEEPFLEDQEDHERKEHADRHHRHPAIAADPAHVEAHEEHGGNVEPEELGQHHEGRRRQQRGQHGPELLAGDEWPVARPAMRLQGNDGAGTDEQHPEPEREETALRAIGAPAAAGGQG